jgi:hypothetical protein
MDTRRVPPPASAPPPTPPPPHGVPDCMTRGQEIRAAALDAAARFAAACITTEDFQPSGDAGNLVLGLARRFADWVEQGGDAGRSNR